MALSCRHAGAEFLARPWGETAVDVSFFVHDECGGHAIDVALLGAGTGAPVPGTAWVGVPTTVDGDNAYVLKAPTGGPWRPACRSAGAVFAAPGPGARVGDITLFVGQSNGSLMADCISGAVKPDARTRMYRNGAWGPATGDGLCSYLNLLAARSGVPQAAIMAAVAGASITRKGHDWMLSRFPGDAGYWLDLSGAPWRPAAAALRATRGRLARAILIGGENDSGGVSGATYYRGLCQLWRNIQAMVTDRQPPALRFAIVPVGNFPVPGTDTWTVAENDYAFAGATPGAYIACNRHDLPRDETDIHLTAEGFRILGRRLAEAIARVEYAA